MENISAGVRPVLNQPMWLLRIWWWLGFGVRGGPHVGHEDGFCEAAVDLRIVSNVSWADRFRILVSGKIQTRTILQTDVKVSKAKAATTLSVPWPGFKETPVS
jgi:hypothetical protein